MTNQLNLFPLLDAYSQLKGYITDPDLQVRVVLLENLPHNEVWIHIEMNEEWEGQLFEQAECYAEDITEWFSHLTVSMVEKDTDWYVIRVRS